MRSLSPLLSVLVFLGLLSLGLAQSTFLSGCLTPLAELPDSITIFYSNETENELYKCCRTYQVGGLSRRASVIAKGDPASSLVVDVGNFSAKRPGNTYDEFKLAYQLRAYELMNYSVLNVGALELNRGEELLRSLGKQTGDCLISANVVGASGSLLFEPYKIVEVAGLKVGIVGLLSEQTVNAPVPLRILPPADALAEVWEELETGSDIQLLLSQLTDEENSHIIQEFPTLDIILGGPGWRQSEQMRPWQENGVVIGRVGVRGKYQGEIMMSIERAKNREIRIGHYSGTATALGDSIPDNPEIETLLDEFAQRLRSGEVLQDVYEKHTEHQQFGYAGAPYCQGCHGEIYAGWLETRHGQANQSLIAKGEQTNPVCLECHTTGYAEPGGFLAKGSTYLLSNVQCESCHGSGAEHMRVASIAYQKRLPILSDWKIATVRTPESTCIKCHDVDNDPHWKNGSWPYERLIREVGCSQWLQKAREK